MKAYILACALLMVVAVQGAPQKLKAGFDIGGSGGTQLTAGGNLRGKLTDPMLLNYDGSGKLAGSAHGGLHGGGYAGYNDNLVGTNGEIHGNVAGALRDVFEGNVGVDKEGRAQIGGTNRLLSDGEFGAGGSGNLNFNKDAEGHVKLYGARSDVQNMLNEKY